MIKKSCRIKYKYCDYFLEYTNFKDDLIEYKSLCGSKSYQHKFDEKSKERFFNTNKFSKHNNNTLLLRKGALFMNIWLIGKNSMKHYYLKKKDSYSHLNMEDIAHANRVCKDFKIKHLGEYHDLFKVIDYC